MSSLALTDPKPGIQLYAWLDGWIGTEKFSIVGVVLAEAAGAVPAVAKYAVSLFSTNSLIPLSKCLMM